MPSDLYSRKLPAAAAQCLLERLAAESEDAGQSRPRRLPFGRGEPLKRYACAVRLKCTLKNPGRSKLIQGTTLQQGSLTGWLLGHYFVTALKTYVVRGRER